MSVFGNIGNAIKKGVKDVGHAVGKVASNPVTELAAGAFCGPACAAALGGVGRLIAPGGNIGKGLVSAAEGGVLGKVGSVGRAAISGAMGANTGGNILQRVGGAVKDAAGKIIPEAQAAVGGTNPDGSTNWGALAKLGLAGVALKGQTDSTKNANDYYNNMLNLHTKQLDAANADYASRAGLRNGVNSTVMAKLGAASQPKQNMFSGYGLGGN